MALPGEFPNKKAERQSPEVANFFLDFQKVITSKITLCISVGARYAVPLLILKTVKNIMGGSVALYGRNIAELDGHKALHYYFQSDPPCSLAGGTLKDENAVRGEPVEP